MAQNTTTENDIRFAHLVMTAAGNGRTIREIGRRRASQGIKLHIAGIYTFSVPQEKLDAMKDSDLLVIGRPNSEIRLDLPLVPESGVIDNRISRIQCIIRRTGRHLWIYDCGINGTELIS